MAEKKTILVVDDDSDVHEFCQTVLENAGYKVETASSAEEGKEKIEKQRPDLVILDIIMETADAGVQMAEWLAQKHAGVPVIMLSSIMDASAQVFDVSQIKAVAQINKPMVPQQLLHLVQKVLGPQTKK